MSDDTDGQDETKDNAPVDLIQHVRDCAIGASKAAMACMWAANEITRLRAELAASAEALDGAAVGMNYWCDGSVNKIIQADLLNHAARCTAAATRAREASGAHE